MKEYQSAKDIVAAETIEVCCIYMNAYVRLMVHGYKYLCLYALKDYVHSHKNLDASLSLLYA